jgi:hypothetical protein
MAEALETGNPFALGKALGRLIPVASDHLPSVTENTRYVKHIEYPSQASAARFPISC